MFVFQLGAADSVSPATTNLLRRKGSDNGAQALIQSDGILTTSMWAWAPLIVT